jgi:hypothetical protein
LPSVHPTNATHLSKIPIPKPQEKTKSDLARANDNYHLVAISPLSVEMLELKAIPNRRTVWHRQTGGNGGDGGDGEWSVLSVAP